MGSIHAVLILSVKNALEVRMSLYGTFYRFFYDRKRTLNFDNTIVTNKTVWRDT